jgi:long-chain acyl-CoA synthetase
MEETRGPEVVAQPGSPEPEAGAIENGREATEPNGHRAALKTAGVAAAVLGGAAVAVGVARAREGREWSRLEEAMRQPGGALRQAGDPTRLQPPITVPQMLQRSADRHATRPAIQHRVGDEWQRISYRELAERVMHFALGLAELGIRRGDRVALLSETRPEWAVADLAILSLGAVNVPLYSTLPAAQVRHIVGDSGAVALIVEDPKQLKKAQEVRGELPDLQHLIVIEAGEVFAADTASFTAVEQVGAGLPGKAERYERLWHMVQPGDLASIIYTSGTTGLPKGAMLTHDNLMSNAQALPELVDIRPTDVFLSALPLAHVFARMAGHYLPLLAGSTAAYSQGLRHLKREMAEVQPTVVAHVPRLYESIQAGIEEGAAKRSPRDRRLFAWALGVGERHNGPLAAGKKPGPLTSLEYRLANQLVLSKLRERVVGNRLRYFISGGAPLAVDTQRFFHAVGWTMLQGYGLTETSPVITLNRPNRVKYGSVGPPIPAVEVQIAADGEILSRGPHIMRGYYNLPEESAQAIDAEGWFHTGDIGLLDDDGYLRITDRKKDIIVLANGKNVAPQPIEAKLLASPFIATPALFGDQQAVVVALIVPNFARLEAWSKERGIATDSRRALLDHPDVRKLYKAEIDAHTRELADFEKIRRFALLEEEFSQDGGELTPTLKVKRRVVADKYAGTLAKLLQGGD